MWRPLRIENPDVRHLAAMVLELADTFEWPEMSHSATTGTDRVSEYWRERLWISQMPNASIRDIKKTAMSLPGNLFSFSFRIYLRFRRVLCEVPDDGVLIDAEFNVPVNLDED